jgi:hypothetical protein
MNRRLAYLTMENTDGWSIDVDLAFPPMEAMGWEVDAVRWRTEKPDWNRYDAVYIGVPWDYPEDPEGFLSTLGTIDESRALLVNDLELVRWSLAKTYLRDLEQRGADIVPSLWRDEMTPETLEEAFDLHGTGRIIVKPVVSTNATDTYLLTRERARELKDELERVFTDRPFVVQPFIESILTDGEYSLFYFNRVLSHATVKVPKKGDFRVQEEHGADLSSITPEAALVETGNHVMSLVEPMPVYTRADFVRGADGRFLVMELELIEPSMYLRMDPEAPTRFAEAFNEYVVRNGGAAN